MDPTNKFVRSGKHSLHAKIDSFFAKKESRVDAGAPGAHRDAYRIVDDKIVFTDDGHGAAAKGPPPPTKSVHAHCLDSRERLTIEGLEVRFPFKPYPCQIQLMSKVIRCLKGLTGGKEHAILESPTGTGKTMSLLCSSIAWLEALKASVALQGGPKHVSPDELTIHTGKEAERVAVDESTVERGNIPRIYFASRTHKQLSQVVQELRKSGYKANFAVLASRSHYCINARVRQAKDINEACFDSLTSEANHCSFINKVDKFLQRDAESALSLGVEELVDLGSQSGWCPYFVARALSATHAEIVFCPFDYIVNPSIREAMGVDLKGAVVIFDEAHNIEDACREAGGVEATGSQLLAIKSELEQYIDPLSGGPSHQLLMPAEHMAQLAVVSVLHQWLVTAAWTSDKPGDFEKDVEIWHGEELVKVLGGLHITKDTVTMRRSQLAKIDEARKQLKESSGDGKQHPIPTRDRSSDCKLLSQGSARVLGSLYRTLLFVFQNDNENLAAFRLVRQREFKFDKDNSKHPVFTLGIWCLNPATIFRDITSQARNVILTSGTLSPMDTFGSELGTHFEHRLEAMHVIGPDQVWVGALSVGPKSVELKGTFKELETFAFQDDIAGAILDVAAIVPDGVLCFLPSYSFMDKLQRRMDNTGAMKELKKTKKVFLEPRQGSLQDFEKLIHSYYSSIGAGRGAIFFAVFRGKASEGLDFSDGNARAVISVGIPFPALRDERVVQKRAYNDLHARTRGLLNGHLWYDKQAYRALNQALGRCIRHRHDWGAIVLLERRFHNPSTSEGLSKWIRPRLQRFVDYQEATKSLSAFILNRTQSAHNQEQEVDEEEEEKVVEEKVEKEEQRVEPYVKGSSVDW